MRDPLDVYLNELGAYSVLTAEQEIELARKIEDLETAHWDALLSYAPAIPTVARAAAPHLTLPRALRRFAKPPTKKGPAAAPKPAVLSRTGRANLARALRDADATRVGLYEADLAVRARFGERSKAKPYLVRVAEARQAQFAVKQRFAAANLRLVIAMARKANRKLMPLADLIQEGNLGLLRAVERFDYRRGFRFSTYAAWWIRHGLNRALSDKARLVRIPVHAIEDGQRLREAELKWRGGGDAPPSAREMAKATGFPLEKVLFLRTHVQQRAPVSLDQQVGDDNTTSFLDLVTDQDADTPEEQLERQGSCRQVREVLSELSPIEASILRYRFGLDDGEELTLREIGDKYNLSRERIRQLQEQALGKLRSALVRRAPQEDSVSAA